MTPPGKIVVQLEVVTLGFNLGRGCTLCPRLSPCPFPWLRPFVAGLDSDRSTGFLFLGPFTIITRPH